MKIGFIGTGSFAIQQAEVLREMGLNISACFGTNAEKTKIFSQTFQCNSYDDPFKLISSKIIDALYIVIPPFAHDGGVELKAVEENIPFLCEKPVGLNLQTCNTISSEVEKNNLTTSSGYQLRYEPLFAKVREIINRNKISTVRVCSYSYRPEVHWWSQEKLSGGMMLESGSHYIDLLRYLFGEIVSVAAITSSGIANCDGYDSMESILKFQDNYIASIGVTHLLNNIQARHDELQIYGDNFALKIDLYKLRYKNEAAVVYKESGDQEWHTISNATSKKTLLRLQSTAFINAIQQNDHSLIRSSYPDAVKTLKVALLMNRSARTHQFGMA